MPTVILNTSETTFVSSAFPNTNYSTNPVIYAGTDPTFQDTISYLRFTLPTLPVTEVDSAILQLSVIIKTGAAPSTVVVNRVTSPLDTETVTYNTRPTITPTATQFNVTTGNLYTTIQIDITDLVNQWINGTFPNYGLALTVPDGITVVGFGTNEILYEPFYPVLILTYSETPPVSPDTYGYIYNTGNQSIAPESSVPFSTNGALLGISHNVGTGAVTIENDGTFAVWFTVIGQTANQFALFQNDIVVPGSIYGTEGTSENNTGMVMINASAGDVLTLRNHTSVAAVVLDNTAGGTQTNVSASLLILRAGPATSPNPALAAVNAAQNITELRAAIEDPALGLDLTAFNALGTTQQDQVLTELLANRPTLGYPTVSSVQDALDTAINELVDPDNIYVQAGQVGGNGSIAHPFGTISAGIAAVNPGGTVHVLAGTYPITAQINFNKAGATLLGEPGTMLILQADLIPLLITGNGAIVNGLTITSDIPYAREFIQVGAPNVSLINNTIYGPPQALPMSNWVVNRAVVSQAGTTNVTLTGNTFYSLRTGMYINPNTTGAINNNVVYNTKGGFLVDGAFTTFLGNSWGVPANEFDIVLLAGTTMGPPYDNLAALSAANNNATISDQR
jgi:hypothetical protein